MSQSLSDMLRCCLPLALLLVFGVPEIRGQLTWIQLQNDTNVTGITSYPPGRRDAVMGYDVSRNQLVLFGGSPGPLGDTWIYDLNRNEWREVNSSHAPRPASRYGAVGGVSGHYFYVATGRGLDDVHYNDVWRLDLRTETWELMSPTPQNRDPAQTGNNSHEIFTPAARYFAAGGIHATGTRIYVTLGSNSNRRTEDTYAYDVVHNVWFEEMGECSMYDPRCPHPRYLHGGVMTDKEEFVIFSGCLSGDGTAGPCPSHDAWRYDGQRKEWTQLDSCPVPRLYSSMAMLPESEGKRYVVLYGGQTDTDTVIQTEEDAANEVAVLDLHSGSWTVRRTIPESNVTDVPGLRWSASMVTGPHGIYLFGGVNHDGVVTNDLWLLRGNATTADQSPSAPCGKTTTTFITVHGILMTLGFGLMLPLGGLMMRYFKCLYTHIAFQILGLCFAIAGFAVGVVSVHSSHFCFVHAIVGVVALGLAVLQPINALFRPKEPRPEERKGAARIVWQFVHRFGGRVSVLLGLVNGSLGVFLAVATLPIVIAWHSWLGVLLLLCLVGEFVRCVVRMRRGRKGKSAAVRSATDQTAGVSVINGWEKVDGGYINPTTESIRL